MRCHAPLRRQRVAWGLALRILLRGVTMAAMNESIVAFFVLGFLTS